MHDFYYLLYKIKTAPFMDTPFRHLLIENFLSADHFDAIVTSPEIARPSAPDTRQLIADLQKTGYEVQEFPGCKNSIDAYLDGRGAITNGHRAGLVDSEGLAMRLKRCNTPILNELLAFLQSHEFKYTLEQRFRITAPNYSNMGVQKYLDGYEISPHPDVREKCMTYMLNVNPSPSAEQDPIHTQLLRFKPERRYIYEFWKYNEHIDRFWVPWKWCVRESETRKNNAIIIFAPCSDTLHGIRLRYDHLKYQRTQIFGNFWYEQSPVEYTLHYTDLDLLKKPERSPSHGSIQTVSRRLGARTKRFVSRPPWKS